MENIGNLAKQLNVILSEGLASENFLAKVGTLYTGIQNGDLVGTNIAGSFADAATASCNPTWAEGDVMDTKTWSLANIAIYKKFCNETLASELKRNQPLDAIGSPAEELIKAQLTESFIQSVVANGFLGYTGSSTAGLKSIDGIFTQMAVMATADPTKKVEIATNTKAAMNAGVTAVDVLENLIDAGSAKLHAASDQILVMTDAMWRAVSYNLKVNKGVYVENQWKALFGGVKETEYDGIPVIVIPTLDGIIANMGADDLFYKKPYLAAYTTKSNILFGSQNTVEAGLADVKVQEDFAAQDTKALVKYSLGAVVANPAYFVLAY